MTKTKYPYNNRNGYAYVYVNRKPVALKAPDGSRCKTGTKEALCAYHRFSLGIVDDSSKSAPLCEQSDVTIAELAAGYLAYSKARRHADYANVQTIVGDFLLPLFGDKYFVGAFTPKCLKKVREAMILSQRFTVINNRSDC